MEKFEIENPVNKGVVTPTSSKTVQPNKDIKRDRFIVLFLKRIYMNADMIVLFLNTFNAMDQIGQEIVGPTQEVTVAGCNPDDDTVLETFKIHIPCPDYQANEEYIAWIALLFGYFGILLFSKLIYVSSYHTNDIRFLLAHDVFDHSTAGKFLLEKSIFSSCSINS